MNKNFAKEVYEIVEKYDPVEHAERLVKTGKTAAEAEEAVQMIALGLQIERSKLAQASLAVMDDTQFSNSVENYLRIAKDIGFEVVMKVPFQRLDRYSKDGQRRVCDIDENQYFLMHRELGILLVFDTYTWNMETGFEVHVNGGHFYYAWMPHNRTNAWRCTSSGGFERALSPTAVKGVFRPVEFWFGNHDCREALRYHIDCLRANGTFLNPWPAPMLNEDQKAHLRAKGLPVKPKPRYLSFLHYVDFELAKETTGGFSASIDVTDKMRAERYAKLPDWVKQICNQPE